MKSRRIDNQLRGRSGRQGDPGRSKFFLSLEDDLMRIFGSDRLDTHAAAARPEGRRGDHPSLDQQGAGEGAAEGRGAQLRHPQEPAEVRQRPERPAQGDLRPAHRPDEGRERRRNGRRHAPRVRRRHRRQARARARLCRAVGRRGPEGRTEARARHRPAGRRMGQGRGHRRRGDCSTRIEKRVDEHMAAKVGAVGPRRHALRREDASCCRRWTISGASIWSCSIICAR